MHNSSRRIGVVAAIVAGVGLCVPVAAHASGPGSYRYTVGFDRVIDEDVPADAAPCQVDAHVRREERVTVTMAASVAGLTRDEVIALAGADPQGLVRQLHSTATGTVRIADAVHTYTGRITEQFSGNFLPNGMYVQTGTLSVTARSELGTSFRFNGGGHDVDDRDGVTVHFNGHGSGTGCLP